MRGVFYLLGVNTLAVAIATILAACSPSVPASTAISSQPSPTALSVKVAPAGEKAPTIQKVRFSLNPTVASYLALFVALERGYFKQAGLEVDVVEYQGSALTQLPLLARGDLDISQTVPGPGLFNQFAQGFDVRIIAAVSEVRKGYLDTTKLVVRKDVWESGGIRQPSDLRGKKVDGAAEGSPIDFLLKQTIVSGGLRLSDVQYSYRGRTPGDWAATLGQQVVDVQGAIDPTASELEKQGLGVKWLSMQDIVPWYQESYLAASDTFVRQQPEAVERFLAAYLRAVREVDAANGRWNPELVAIAKKWTKFSEEVLQAMGGLPYIHQNATPRRDALERMQQFWIEQGLVKNPAPVDRIVDTGPLDRALKRLGER